MRDALIERARQLIETNRYSEAEQNLRTLLSEDANNLEVISLLAICQAEAGKLDEAIKLIKSAISQDPSNPYFLYIYATFLLREEKSKEAEKIIRSAISFNPTNADFYGLLSMIKIDQRDWNEALKYANEGLSFDSDHLSCLNARSTALLKLDKKEEAYATIKEALDHDPENDVTHTNIGWGLLEKGEHKKALEHFREALRINPHSAYAKAGMVQGLKARYWFYRIFLQYAFWLNNFKSKAQWAIIIGLYIGFRILNSISESNPELSIFIKPLVVLYMIFAISTWIITPLSNLFLRLNVYGRYALTEDEVTSSNFTGVAFLIGLVGGVSFLFTQNYFFVVLMIFGIGMMIPLSAMLNPTKKSSRTVLVAYTAALGLVGILMLGFGGALLAQIFVFGIVAFQFLSNAMVIR